MAQSKAAKVTQFQKSMLQTEALKDYVPKDLRPLFEHVINLAKHSHSVGYAKRAGQELKHARSLAKPPEDYMPPSIPKPQRVSDTERTVLAIAKVDHEDDRDGAEFFEAKQKAAVKKLAARGFLRIMSQDRKVVRAVLTDSGVKLYRELRGETEGA